MVEALGSERIVCGCGGGGEGRIGPTFLFGAGSGSGFPPGMPMMQATAPYRMSQFINTEQERHEQIINS